MNYSSDYYTGASFHQSQERIKQLFEDKKRTMRQLEHDPTFDEIDQLQVSVDQGYNTDLNKYRENVKEYSHNIRRKRDLDPEEKARRLGNIRHQVSNFNPTTSAPNINYQAAKPIMHKQIDKLNGIIMNEKQKETERERRRVLENMSTRVPNFSIGQNRYSVIEQTKRTDAKNSQSNRSMMTNYKQVGF